MSTYYQYKDVKVKIAHRLMKMDGWTVYGYHADNSDSMTDYYDPAYWDGIATKNGYTLVIDKCSEKESYTETRTRYATEMTADTREKIKKLEAMTQERGASEQEEQTARAKIKALQDKAEAGRETYTIFHPGHKANPPRCNWHIEKDGIIVDKGNGLLKFASVPDISGYGYSWEREEWQKYNTMSADAWKADFIRNYERKYSAFTDEGYAAKYADSAYADAKKKYDLLEKFNLLISRFNSICGGMMGDADKTYTFEEVTVTKYKTEIKPKESATGSFKTGQCFILKSSFNYGRNKGYIYRIHETRYEDGKVIYSAYRMNGKNTKECTGSANPANHWFIGSEPDARMLKWFERGALAWCELVEVKTPYEVKKVVKKYNESDTEEAPHDAPETTTSTDNHDNTEKADTTPGTYAEAPQDAEAAENASTADAATGEEKHADNANESGTVTQDMAKDARSPLYNDDFENLAKAYATGKTLKSKRAKTAQTAETAESNKIHTDSGKPQQEAPQDATQGKTENAEPEESPVPDPLYNDNFSAKDIATLITGGRVMRDVNNYTVHYIATRSDRNNCTWYLYKQENYHSNNFRIGKYGGLIYCGFIFGGRVYTNTDKINEEFRKYIDSKIREMLPDVDAVLKKCEISDFMRKEIESYKTMDFTREIRRYFLENKNPDFSLVEEYHKPQSDQDALNFITDRENASIMYAKTEIETHPEYIAKTYVKYNSIMAGLAEIRNDPGRPEHIAKAVINSVNDEKTVTIKTHSGESYRVRKSAISSIGYNMKIYSYELSGRKDDLQIEEIAEITHGRRILYKCA